MVPENNIFYRIRKGCLIIIINFLMKNPYLSVSNI